jgi:hypothetical protein
MLMGIYSMEENIMEFIISFVIEKVQEVRKNKQRVAEVQNTRTETYEQQKRFKIKQSNKSRKVTFQLVENPNEDDVDIGANEVTSLAQNKKKQEKHKRNMTNDEEIVDLYENTLNHKRRKSNGVFDE